MMKSGTSKKVNIVDKEGRHAGNESRCDAAMTNKVRGARLLPRDTDCSINRTRLSRWCVN